MVDALKLNGKIPQSPDEWDVLAKMAQEQPPLKGPNNHNYIVRIGECWFKIRIPIPNRLEMDLHRLPEYRVQKFLYDQHLNVPNIFHFSESPPYQVQEYLPVPVLDHLYPRGSRLPEHYIGDVVEFLSRLYSLSTDWLLPYFDNWPVDGDTSGFLDRITRSTVGIYNRYFSKYHELYRQLGIPNDIVSLLYQINEPLTPRSFVLCHSDIHRKNCLLVGKTSWFIDWEMALFGDPGFDVGVHLSKVEYLPDEEDRFLELITKKLDRKHQIGIVNDSQVYKKHAFVKSVIVHAVRYHKLISERSDSSTLSDLALKYENKLARAVPIIGNKPLRAPEIERIFVNYINNESCASPPVGPALDGASE